MVESKEHPMCSFDAKEDVWQIEFNGASVSVFYHAYEEDIIKKGLIKEVHMHKVYHEEEPLKKIPSCLSEFKNLEKLKIRDTNVERLENIDLPKLDTMYISHSNISKLENLDGLLLLDDLYIRFSKIGKIEGLDALKNLRSLDLSFNNIKKIEGLDNLSELIFLYLRHNDISRIEGIKKNKKLNALNLRDNNISRVENLNGLERLKHLVLDGNEIRVFSELEHIGNAKFVSIGGNHLKELPKINPVIYDDEREIRFEREMKDYHPRAMVQNEESLIQDIGGRNKVIITKLESATLGGSREFIDRWIDEWNENVELM